MPVQPWTGRFPRSQLFDEQRTDGVEHCQDHHTHIGEDGQPHIGEPQGHKHQTRQLDADGKDDVFIDDPQDHIIPHLHWGSAQPEGPSSRLRRTTMMVLAVTLHNIPEGMAVGVVCAGYLAGDTEITAMGVLALSLGIAVQNFPEGAIVSMPLRAEGEGKLRAFAGGVLSGVVEPIGALVTILAAELLVPALPYLLGFAAGAMLYVVVEEMIPEMSQGRHSHIGVLAFAAGFSVMMVLDVALG